MEDICIVPRLGEFCFDNWKVGKNHGSHWICHLLQLSRFGRVCPIIEVNQSSARKMNATFRELIRAQPRGCQLRFLASICTSDISFSLLTALLVFLPPFLPLLSSFISEEGKIFKGRLLNFYLIFKYLDI